MPHFSASTLVALFTTVKSRARASETTATAVAIAAAATATTSATARAMMVAPCVNVVDAAHTQVFLFAVKAARAQVATKQSAERPR